jgi:hypothetical protein
MGFMMNTKELYDKLKKADIGFQYIEKSDKIVLSLKEPDVPVYIYMQDSDEMVVRKNQKVDNTQILYGNESEFDLVMKINTALQHMFKNFETHQVVEVKNNYDNLPLTDYDNSPSTLQLATTEETVAETKCVVVDDNSNERLVLLRKFLAIFIFIWIAATAIKTLV